MNMGGWPTPLKNMKVGWDDDIPNIWKNKIHVPNNQPGKNQWYHHQQWVTVQNRQIAYSPTGFRIIDSNWVWQTVIGSTTKCRSNSRWRLATRVNTTRLYPKMNAIRAIYSWTPTLPNSFAGLKLTGSKAILHPLKMQLFGEDQSRHDMSRLLGFLMFVETKTHLSWQHVYELRL